MTRKTGKRGPYVLETTMLFLFSVMGAALSICLHMVAPSSFAFRTSVFMTLSVMALTVTFALLSYSTRKRAAIEIISEPLIEAEQVIT